MRAAPVALDPNRAGVRPRVAIGVFPGRRGGHVHGRRRRIGGAAGRGGAEQEERERERKLCLEAHALHDSKGWAVGPVARYPGKGNDSVRLARRKRPVRHLRLGRIAPWADTRYQEDDVG